MFLKVVIAGDGATGKTTISKQLTGSLKDKQELEMTPGIDFHTLKISGNNKEAVIWDLGGQQHFRSFQDSFFQNANIVIFVFDVTSFESFLNIDSWISLIKNENISHIYLLGNKIDLENRAITKQEAEQYAKAHDLDYFEISALKKIKFKEFKKDIIDKIVNKYSDKKNHAQDFFLKQAIKERI